ncbi:sterol desaturase family protein [Novosphingobium lentum]|uniref:sterol desaturase family protein n=1 Tax=Novosphingobium lentum TaxID=145287 RepID=UPI00083528DC|nr:sterol desaturase family protein [Novosphingobium lentum]
MLSPDSADDARLPFWKRSHYLDRMDLKQLSVAYFQHYTIMAYLALTALCVAAWFAYPAAALATAGSVLAGVVIYPLVWHLLHQYVLHGRWMWRWKVLAPTWKRIHYDHHQDPNHLEVLFGALHTTLPTIALATLPVGWLIGGAGGAAAAFATGLLTTCYYEYMHCIQHLAFKPKWKWVQTMKQRHVEHHYFDEDGNFGITNYFWDRVLGTYYEKKDRPKRSATVFNLGYDEEVAKRWPWVKELSGGIASGHPRRRAMGKEAAGEPSRHPGAGA